MNYNLKGYTVASHNSAKTPSQASANVLALIAEFKPNRHIVDYGCGKLRYAGSLALKCEKLTLVDSPNQLDRPVKLDETNTTVRELANTYWKNCEVISIRDFQKSPPHDVDIVFCANVLSAIPSKSERTKALRSIRSCLNSCGKLILINQHTNSFYSNIGKRDNAIPHLDGHIVPNKSNSSYYGILNKETTAEILKHSGFNISEHWIDGQSNIAIATPIS